MQRLHTRRGSLKGLACVTCLAIALQGCATGQGAPPPVRRNASSLRPYATAPSPSVITEGELRDVRVATLEDAVRRLRPEFFRVRAAGVLGRIEAAPDVYVDGRYYGGLRSMAAFRPWEIVEVRMLSPNESAVRFGTSHPAGAIAVQTR